MYQPWSFWAAWIIIVGGLVTVALWVVWVERRDRVDHDRWLSDRRADIERRNRWLEDMFDAD
jgi:hypothetical protein